MRCGLIVILHPSDHSSSSNFPTPSNILSLPLLSQLCLSQIAKQMKKFHKEISQVSSGQEDQTAKVNLMQRKYLEMVCSNRNEPNYL